MCSYFSKILDLTYIGSGQNPAIVTNYKAKPVEMPHTFRQLPRNTTHPLAAQAVSYKQ